MNPILIIIRRFEVKNSIFIFSKIPAPIPRGFFAKMSLPQGQIMDKVPGGRGYVGARIEQHITRE